MLLTALHLVLAGLGINLGVDGLKLFAWFDRQPVAVKQAAPFIAALIVALAVRGFTLPNTLLGIVWFLGVVIALGLIAGGWFRARKALAPHDTSATIAP